MLEASALEKLGSLPYLDMTDESLSVQMTLMNSYLYENIGATMSDLNRSAVSYNVYAGLHDLTLRDPLLERQIYQFRDLINQENFQNTFEAKWTV